MTKRTPIFTAGLAIALLVCCFSFYKSVSAIEGESIVLSPASKRLEANAGDTIRDTMKVINDGTVSYDFVVYGSPYSVANKTYIPNFDDKKPNADLYTWVNYDKKEYTLNPGESVDVPYNIVIPVDAAPGGHYSVLFAETQVSESSSGQIARKKRVGAIVYATVKGDYITAGKQTAAQIDWLQLGGPISTYLTIENTGNSDFIMTDYMRVSNVFGKKVYEKSNERIMLPKTTRDIQMNWIDGPLMGLYNVTTESKVLGKTTSQSSWVLLMPAWVVVSLVLAIAAIIYVAFIRHRR